MTHFKKQNLRGGASQAVPTLFYLVAACLFLLLQSRVVAVDQPDAMVVTAPLSESFVTSKRNALDVAGALLNDGFRIRDGVWMVSLVPKQPAFLQVTLFAGNQYWFAAAAAPPATSLKVSMYDGSGHLLKLDVWKDNLTVPGSRAAGGFVAPHSGKYFVGLELLNSQGGAKADASLVYAYK